jgi:hypothetical protein
MMKSMGLGWGFWLLAVAMTVMLVFAAWGFTVAWKMAGNAPMSIHGYVALGLGVVLSLVLGGGLMALAFFSSRRGYDDDQGH